VPEQYKLRHNDQSVEIAPVPLKNNFSGIKFIPLPGYPEYVYPEGDEETKNRLIKQLMDKGIKPVKDDMERAEEEIKKAKDEGRLASA
jgi:hypothetical protein